MRTLNRCAIAICLCGLVALALPSGAAAQNVPFKVFITELWQLDAGVDPVLGLIGDYYAKVTINGVEQSNSGACDDGSSTGILVPLQLFKNFNAASACGAKTPWMFTRDVPAGQPVTVRIQIFDSDAAFDDEADARPGSGNSVNITIDPATGQWSGDVTWPQTCSRPNLDLGGNNVNVCFQASFDTDDDGLLDVWEQSGVDTDNDGVNDIDLAALGANRLRKDVFLEADFVAAATHSHSPRLTAVSQVVAAFANAPVANPDGTTGIQLHIDVGTALGGGIVPVAGMGGVTGSYGDLGGGGTVIPEAGNEIIDEFGGSGTAPTFADLKSTRFDARRDYVFRYVIFGHQTNARVAANDCTSGQASVTRRDFLVTLGGVDSDGDPCWTTDAAGFSVGSIDEQAGTLMHEFGHALGLMHGGNIDVNDKPNYLSVMNYSFQSCDVPVSAGLLPGGCDFSRLVSGSLLPTLDETDLDECAGIGGGLGFGQVDWDGDGLFEGAGQCGAVFANVDADINKDGICITPGTNGRIDTPPAGDDILDDNRVKDGQNRVCNTTVAGGTDDVQAVALGGTPAQPKDLESFDDWAGITLSVIADSPFFGNGTPDQEPDSKTIRESKRRMGEMMAPNVTLDLTGPATGKPGDVLTYDVAVANTGRGPALVATLGETAPDGIVRTTALGTLVSGAAAAQSSSFTIPAAACPGDLTSASASLAFKDFAGTALSVADAVPLQVLDVAAPDVALSVSPDVLWPPNHKFRDVTATLVVTDNCDPQPAVQLVSIESSEPAEGFLGNGDRGPDVSGAALGTDDRTFALRAERKTGRGATGRVYTITYRVTDRSGNATEKTATVTVPANNSGR